MRKILLLVLMAILSGIKFSLAQEMGTATPVPLILTPTIDRLAAPPTVENPTQADEGAQLFWLHCQPCHGDQGQGLTDEWRAQYPPEDQNCWNSGCHGNRPYEEGFTLPQTVPAVIGSDTLSRFETMAQVHDFVRTEMPFQAAGSLTEAEYLAITAFLARARGVWHGRDLTQSNVAEIRLQPLPAVTAEGQPVSPTPGSEFPQARPAPVPLDFFLWGGLIALGFGGGLWLWRRRG